MRTSLQRFENILSVLFIVFYLPVFSQTQNFPPLNFVIDDSAATQGYYFMSPYTTTPPFGYDRPHLILDQYGRIVFYRIFAGGSGFNPTLDFELQPDGRMSYFDAGKLKFFLMDSTFTVVDSIACVNGFETDEHDFQIISGNHYLLFGKEIRIEDLSSYHWFGFYHNQPGSTHAQVTGVVIQEFDENKTLVFEWKGHDHYQFGDVNQEYLFSPSKVDWTHANAVELDQDSNILLSLRHFNEITKINHTTGDIIWRMGGKQNQFTFPNDPVGFSGQHDIRRVSDTSVSMWDNGQYTNPPMGRALEYALDETNKIANLVWAYVYDSSMFSTACGNHQYSENGNHVIDFGYIDPGFPFMVVVKPDKTKVIEVYWPNGYISYRAFNYITLPWQLHRPNVTCQKTGENYWLIAEPGHPEYLWSTGATTSSIQITNTGYYWVFVPYGTGFMCSEYIHITDLTDPCLFEDTPPRIIPAEISLKCLPNLMTEQTRIRFSLPVNSNVVISLISLLGTEIQRPVQGYYPAGDHEVTMDVSSLDKGVYILSMSADRNRVTSRFIVQ